MVISRSVVPLNMYLYSLGSRLLDGIAHTLAGVARRRSAAAQFIWRTLRTLKDPVVGMSLGVNGVGVWGEVPLSVEMKYRAAVYLTNRHRSIVKPNGSATHPKVRTAGLGLGLRTLCLDLCKL